MKEHFISQCCSFSAITTATAKVFQRSDGARRTRQLLFRCAFMCVRVKLQNGWETQCLEVTFRRAAEGLRFIAVTSCSPCWMSQANDRNHSRREINNMCHLILSRALTFNIDFSLTFNSDLFLQALILLALFSNTRIECQTTYTRVQLFLYMSLLLWLVYWFDLA